MHWIHRGYIFEPYLNPNKMKTEMTPTGQTIKTANGNLYRIFSKLTKKGVRFYYFSKFSVRYFPISELELNQLIVNN